MNQRQAKKEACLIASRMIERWLHMGDGVIPDYPDEDIERIEKALSELSDEMYERSLSKEKRDSMRPLASCSE